MIYPIQFAVFPITYSSSNLCERLKFSGGQLGQPRIYRGSGNQLNFQLLVRPFNYVRVFAFDSLSKFLFCHKSLSPALHFTNQFWHPVHSLFVRFFGAISYPKFLSDHLLLFIIVLILLLCERALHPK